MDKGEFLKGVIILLLSYIYIDHIKQEERPIVEIENGVLRGVFSSSSEYRSRYKAFMGIPYGEPPIGDLRFEPPQPSKNWTGIRDAGYYRSQCISLDILFSGIVFGSEDCLFINVFVPITLTPARSHLPVMVFIHGGYWHGGSSQDHGEKRFMNEDIILVSFNYRLGALGFLSTGDEIVRGNQGLKDQVLALKWVQKNIKYFGGDKERVTIFGESVGAVSVHLHILSPASKGLFHRAISQSGTALNVFSRNSFPKSQSKHFAKGLKCPTHNSQEMVQCLKQLHVSTIVNAHREAFDVFDRNRLSMFAATVEAINDNQTFLSEEPLEILKRGDYPKIPWITGVNSHEGSAIVAGVSANKTKQSILKDPNFGFPAFFWYKRNDQVTKKIFNYYFGESKQTIPKELYLANLTDAISDYWFNHPLSQSVKLHSANAETYLYFYNHTGFFSLHDFFADKEDCYIHPVTSILFKQIWRAIKEFVFGISIISGRVCHGDELPLLFTQPWTPYFMSMLPERDAVISRDLVRLWTSFAKSWDTLVFDRVTWIPFNSTAGSLRYLEISSSPKMIDEPFTERMKFWNSINKDLLDSDKISFE